MTVQRLVALCVSVVFGGTLAAQTPPTCALSLSPASGPGGTGVVASAVVTPGTSPVSTGLAMTLDTSAVGGGILFLLDNGVAPDVTAGDNLFTAAFTVAPATPAGSYSLPGVVTDAQARSSNCLASFVVPGAVVSMPIASDGFEYTPVGSALGSYTIPRGAGFSGTWYEQFGTWTVLSPTMSYFDGVNTLRTFPGRVRTVNAEGRRNLYLPGGPIGNVTSTVWVSMVVQQTGGVAANTFGGLTLPTGLGTGLFVGKPFNRSVWGIENGPGTTLLTSVPVTSSAFLVMRVDFQPGNDNVYLWVNPSLAAAPSVGTANIAAPAYGNFENIRILLLHAGGSNPITMDADEIRLGYSYADVAPFGLPANDECAGALPAMLGTNVFDNSNASTSAGSACGAIGADTWFTFTPPTTDAYTIDTCSGVAFDSVVAVYDACGGTLLACNDDTCGLQSLVTICGTAGTPIKIRIGGFNAGPGYGSFRISQGDPNDVGETPSTVGLSLGANPITGVIGNGCGGVDDADVYVIAISDPTNFVATTVGGASFDTQLFLFDAAGNGITSNDDNPSGGLQSTITGAFVPGPGLYYLAISSYDKDPIDSGAAALWLDTPFNVERTPDGPGGANPWAGFDSTSTAGGAYSIFVGGTSSPAKPNPCLAGWLGMDDVCPVNPSGQVYDYAKGALAATLSSPDRPIGVPNSTRSDSLVDNCALFGVDSAGNAKNTFVDFSANSAVSLSIQNGVGGGATGMAWIKPNLVHDPQTGVLPPDLVVLDALGNQAVGYRIYLHPHTTNGTNYVDFELRADVRLGGALVPVDFPFGTSAGQFIVRAGAWTHVSLSLTWGTGSSSGVATYIARELGGAGNPPTRSVSNIPVGAGTNASLGPRVGASAGSSSSLYFMGLLDEVQLYDCALTAVEVAEIQTAGSAGVAKEKLYAPWETGSQAESNVVDVHGVLVVDHQGHSSDPLPDYLLTYSPTPSGGAASYCNTTPFPVAGFTPATAILSSVPRGITPFTVHIDTDPVRFIGHSCFNVWATNSITGVSTMAMSSIVDHPRWWADLDPLNPNNVGHPFPGPNTPGFKEVPIGTPTTWHFRLSNATNMDRYIEYKIAAMPADMSMSPVPVTLSLGAGVQPGPCPSSSIVPGVPVCGSYTVLANSTYDLPAVTATIQAGAGTENIFEIVLYADIDGSGTLTANEDLASAGIIARLMPTPMTPPCSCHGTCVADFDDGSGTGVPDGGVTIDDLLYYLGLFEAGVSCCDVDDGSGMGVPDGGVTIDDLLYFLVSFEMGC